MEVKLENKIKLNSDCIIGIMDQKNYLLEYLETINFTKKNISLNGKKLTQKELLTFKRKISIIDSYITDNYLGLTVYEYMKCKIFDDMLDIKDYRKKISDSLRIVGLSDTYLDKKISRLSKVEQQWINFSIGLFSNPDIILLSHVFHSMDIKNTKKIMRLIQQLAEQYHKIVLIYTNNAEVIYKYTDYTIVISKEKVLVEDTTENIFQNNYEVLLENNIEIPKAIEFSHLVNSKKNIKLRYFKDVRDLIKDIYKKV